MKKILIVGGDNRNIYLYEMFKCDGYEIKKIFLDEESINDLKLIDKSDIIVTSIPFSNDNKYIYSPLSTKRIAVEDFINFTKNKIIFGGKFHNEFIEKLDKNNKVFDLMKNEELVMKNTIPTAEGIIKYIVENTDITINDSKIAVLGFGRVGKVTADILKKLNASIYCFDKKKEEVANIELCRYNVIEDIYSDLRAMDIIINTVPEQIIDSNVLNNISKNTFLLDVASKPGGIDYEYAKLNGYNIIHALGIPGKVAPKTSARYIKELIEKNI